MKALKAKEHEEKAPLRKQAIAQVAARLFDKRGYLETSLQDVSTEGGFSKGAIYYYFASKHELLFFILDTYCDSLLEGLSEELERLPRGLPRVEVIVRRHMALYNNRVPEARALLLDAHQLPKRDVRVLAGKQKVYAAFLTEALSDHLGGKLSVVHVKAMTYVLFGMCNSVMHWHDPAGPISTDELTEMCLNIFLRGITRPTGLGLRPRKEGA
jgi:AcrR family transcriptional regulator